MKLGAVVQGRRSRGDSRPNSEFHNACEKHRADPRIARIGLVFRATPIGVMGNASSPNAMAARPLGQRTEEIGTVAGAEGLGPRCRLYGGGPSGCVANVLPIELSLKRFPCGAMTSAPDFMSPNGNAAASSRSKDYSRGKGGYRPSLRPFSGRQSHGSPLEAHFESDSQSLSPDAAAPALGWSISSSEERIEAASSGRTRPMRARKMTTSSSATPATASSRPSRSKLGV